MEDAIEKLFDARKIGRILGGATGSFYSYIDLLVFDMDEFNAAINDVLSDFEVGVKCVLFSEILPSK